MLRPQTGPDRNHKRPGVLGAEHHLVAALNIDNGFSDHWSLSCLRVDAHPRIFCFHKPRIPRWGCRAGTMGRWTCCYHMSIFILFLAHESHACAFCVHICNEGCLDVYISTFRDVRHLHGGRVDSYV